MADSKQLVRIETIANLAGVTVRRIQQLTQEGVLETLPANDGGTGRMYDCFPTIHNLLVYYREKAEKAVGLEPMANVKYKQVATKTTLDEIKLKRALGELHHTEDIKRVIGAIFRRYIRGLNHSRWG